MKKSEHVKKKLYIDPHSLIGVGEYVMEHVEIVKIQQNISNIILKSIQEFINNICTVLK